MNEDKRSKRSPGLREQIDDPAYQALMDGDIEAFNRLLLHLDLLDLSYANLVGADLRGVVEIGKVKLVGARLRQADLRGLDLSGHDLDGLTINGARISGTRFPSNLSASEIRLGLEHGTRLRPDAS